MGKMMFVTGKIEATCHGYEWSYSFVPVAAYLTEKAAEDAIARSIEAAAEIQELEKACGHAMGSCDSRTELYQFLSLDGRWYGTEQDKEVADKIYELKQTERYKELKKKYTEEVKYYAVPLSE